MPAESDDSSEDEDAPHLNPAKLKGALRRPRHADTHDSSEDEDAPHLCPGKLKKPPRKPTHSTMDTTDGHDDARAMPADSDSSEDEDAPHLNPSKLKTPPRMPTRFAMDTDDANDARAKPAGNDSSEDEDAPHLNPGKFEKPPRRRPMLPDTNQELEEREDKDARHETPAKHKQASVEILARTQEWGEDDEDSSSDDDNVPAYNPNDRYARYNRIAQELAKEAEDATGRTASKEEPQPDTGWFNHRICLGLVHCFFFMVYNAVDASLLYFLFFRRNWAAVAAMAPSAIFMIAVEVSLACTDRDIVQLYHRLRRQSMPVKRVLLQVIVIIFLGCFYGYRLLLAYRQFFLDARSTRTFFTELEALDASRQLLAEGTRRDSHDLIWGPPIVTFLVCSLASGAFELPEAIIWIVVLALVVSELIFLTVHFDFSASVYIRTSYGMVFDRFKWTRCPESQARLGRVQSTHYAFRSSELIGRVAVLGLIASELCNYPQCLVGMLFADYLSRAGGIYLICGFSLEGILLSIVVFLFNVAHFVDEPGYAYPAVRLSRCVVNLNWAQLALATLMHLSLGGFSSSVLLVVAYLAYGVNWVLRTSSVLSGLKGDLFTAVLRSDTERIKESLSFNGGCTVNMKLCDPSKMTALHLAAAEGLLVSAACLLEHGAAASSRDARGESPLHHACRRGDLAMAQTLLEGEKPGEDLVEQMNERAEMPSEVLGRNAPTPLVRLLTERQERARDRTNSCSSTRSRLATEDSCIDLMVRKRKSQRESIFGSVVNGENFHVWAGPRAQDGRMELAFFMFARGIGENMERLVEFIDARRNKAKILLPCLKTESALGAGGFGKVLKVQDVRTGELYAMKVQIKQKVAKQAVREARALSQYRNPFIVELVHIFHTTIFFGILMELCDKDLNVTILSGTADPFTGGLPQEQAARYTACIMLALEHLHIREVIFRDLKPENVLVTSKEKGDLAKLADFGLARTLEPDPDPQPDDSSSTKRLRPRMSLKAGTLAFMAAEAAGYRSANSTSYGSPETRVEAEGGSIDSDWYAARDWYGLGCCLLLMLLGERGGRRIHAGRRDVLLPPPQEEIIGLLSDALQEDFITEEAFDAISGLTAGKASERRDSGCLRSTTFLQKALVDLEPLVQGAAATSG